MPLMDKDTLGDRSPETPAIASFEGALVMAWKGSSNDNLYVMVSEDGVHFDTGERQSYGDSSDCGPALATHEGRLFIAWKGSGNDNLNVAELVPNTRAGSTPVAFDLVNKQTFGDSSDHAPSLASFGNRLILSWKGSGNENLNVATVAL